MQVSITVDVKDLEELKTLQNRLGVESEYELIETVLTKEEKRELKEHLFESLRFIAMERPEFYPRKKDSLKTLMSSFFCWAQTYNDGYFLEREDVENDKLCSYLVEQYEYYYN